MGFLERAIRRGVSDAVGKAVGNAVQQAVEPTATRLVNQAANSIDNATRSAEGKAQQTVVNTSGLEGAMANLQRSVEGYATEAAKNVKICPNCNQPSTADKKFCPGCGAKLPEQTVAEGTVCSSCGKQNSVGTKFCSDCGTKLPAAVEEEKVQANKEAQVMAEWDEKLAAYPKWNCGGTNFCIEILDGGYIMFAPDFQGNSTAARSSVVKYRELLMQNGFVPAGQYPSIEHLYKKEGTVCYHVDTEHCFDGDSDSPTVYFNIGEPTGGFDYIKPEEKKTSFRDLFKF